MPSSTDTMDHCVVCREALQAAVYRSPQPRSLTSLAELREAPTVVFFCRGCGHLQTRPIEGLDEYYESQYKLLLDSPEEDQLYKVEHGRKIYRVPFQVDTLLNKLDLPSGARVLDYGCAKGATARRLAETGDDVQVHLFDVSRQYRPFWEQFVGPDRWATHELPESWRGTLDVVMSFFVLEHVTDPVGVLRSMSSLLKPGGRLYFIVPNVYANTADFVVVDHVNHFSKRSIETVLDQAGLRPVDIDDTSHDGAWITVAVDGATPVEAASPVERVQELAGYWEGLADRIRTFEAGQRRKDAAIYGSGFYGTFLATCLEDPSRVECFLDQNPFRQGQELLGRPILAPEQLPESVHTVYVGLNPAAARSIIDGLDCWRGRPHEYFFL